MTGESTVEDERSRGGMRLARVTGPGRTARGTVVVAAIVAVIAARFEAGIASGAPSSPIDVTGSGPPNLIVIVTDDQGIDAIEGHPSWTNRVECHTPRLADLAAQGLVFSQCRAHPLCSPTRASMMTGRYGLETGVTHVVNRDAPPPLRDRVSLRASERTIAEVIDDAYHTILIDKWHLGWDDPMLLPPNQGFDVFVDATDEEFCRDLPHELGDEHTPCAVARAAMEVQARPDPGEPYALFFWSADPHSRPPDGCGLRWWEMARGLAPRTQSERLGGPCDVDDRFRYRAVVEMLDEQVFRMLHQLGVVDETGTYRPSSHTLVLFTSDNGTPSEVVRPDRADRVKGTLFEGGLRVPLLAFGAGVEPGTDDRPVAAVDLFETIADVAGADDAARGDALRHSRSFADALGVEVAPPVEPRRYTLSSVARDPDAQRVAIADARYKLVAGAGGAGLADPIGDDFYDLFADPDEAIDLVETLGLDDLPAEYFEMRAELEDRWFTAVSEPLEADDLVAIDVSLESVRVVSRADGEPAMERGVDPVTVGHLSPESSTHEEYRAFLRFEPATVTPPPGFSLASATVVLVFDGDVPPPDGTDTGPVGLHEATDAPVDPDALFDAVDLSQSLGDFDPAHDVLVVPAGQNPGVSGLPMPWGTPIAMGRTVGLTARVTGWIEDPVTNSGVALVARELAELPGDQRIHLLADAVLRLRYRRD